MTSLTRRVSEAVEASRACADIRVTEDLGRLTLIGKLSDAALSAWARVSTGRPDWLQLTYIDQDDQYLSIEELPLNERITVNVRFTSPPRAACLFSIEGWNSLLLGDKFEDYTEARLAFAEESFSTGACTVAPWNDELGPGAEHGSTSQTGPRRHVRCHSTDFMAPRSIGHWILLHSSTPSGKAFDLWKCRATEMLVRSLPNELYCEGTRPFAVLTGQNQRRIPLGFPTSAPLNFELLQKAVCWVYLDATDVEARHTFLSSELAREWPTEKSVCEGLPGRLPSALDAAELVYKAHIRAGSKDVLKALADLRKTLSEEVQKLLQHTRDLSTSVWRDVAVAVGVSAIRISSNVTSEVSAKGFGWVFLILAVYICVSYIFNRTTNDRFIVIMEETRKSWRGKLYGFLDEADYKALAENPLLEAMRTYRSALMRADIIVFAVVVSLAVAAAAEFGILKAGANAFTAHHLPPVEQPLPSSQAEEKVDQPR